MSKGIQVAIVILLALLIVMLVVLSIQLSDLTETVDLLASRTQKLSYTISEKFFGGSD